LAQQTPTVCAVHPFTGRFAFAGIEGSAAMQDVVDMTNEAGGINGKKIHFPHKFVADLSHVSSVEIKRC
jgi:ABC-type branched-subunit amino acid transport system substrate-binding protein